MDSCVQTKSAQTVADGQHVARWGISNEKIFFKRFFDKVEIERRSNFENFLAVYLWRRKKCVTNSFH
jgi:hypothetical protein